MLRVHVWYHKDGDHLAISRIPWWIPSYEWLANRFCPCCGLSGLIFKLYGNAETGIGAILGEKHYSLWTWLLEPTYKLEKQLYKVPIESGCVASKAIWNRKEACWRDGCENCWDLRGDAFVSEGEE
jgi:hypothetical protein